MTRKKTEIIEKQQLGLFARTAGSKGKIKIKIERERENRQKTRKID